MHVLGWSDAAGRRPHSRSPRSQPPPYRWGYPTMAGRTGLLQVNAAALTSPTGTIVRGSTRWYSLARAGTRWHALPPPDWCPGGVLTGLVSGPRRSAPATSWRRPPPGCAGRCHGGWRSARRAPGQRLPPNFCSPCPVNWATRWYEIPITARASQKVRPYRWERDDLPSHRLGLVNTLRLDEGPVHLGDRDYPRALAPPGACTVVRTVRHVRFPLPSAWAMSPVAKSSSISL
jgi:hypothetical protein